MGNYADAAFLVEYARETFGEAKARAVYDHLERNGGDPTGERIADVDYQATSIRRSSGRGTVSATSATGPSARSGTTSRTRC